MAEKSRSSDFDGSTCFRIARAATAVPDVKDGRKTIGDVEGFEPGARLPSDKPDTAPDRRLPGLWVRILVIVMLLFLQTRAAHAADQNDLWQALRDNKAFAMMRHAIAPGFGDPAEFSIDDCSTQRNLSDEGRAQARNAGDIFRSNGIAEALVFSSQWCRCRETARLLDLGPVETLKPLNSFFGKAERKEAQTRDLKAWLARQRGDKPLLLVTHQVNISALADRGVGSGEIVVFGMGRAGDPVVLGSIVP